MLNVFIYGTLRAGEPNDMLHVAARHGLAEPRLIGPATVRGKLYDFGNYPGIVVDGTGVPVIGDVYEIESALVSILDEIERAYPGIDGLFVGREITLEVGGQPLVCLFYPVTESAVQGKPEIASGDWVAHRRSRSADGVLATTRNPLGQP